MVWECITTYLYCGHLGAVQEYQNTTTNCFEKYGHLRKNCFVFQGGFPNRAGNTTNCSDLCIAWGFMKASLWFFGTFRGEGRGFQKFGALGFRSKPRRRGGFASRNVLYSWGGYLCLCCHEHRKTIDMRSNRKSPVRCTMRNSLIVNTLKSKVIEELNNLRLRSFLGCTYPST